MPGPADSDHGQRIAALVTRFYSVAEDAQPEALDELVLATCQEQFGAIDAQVWLVDHQQRVLVPFSDGDVAIDIDGTLAGRCYTTCTIQIPPDGSTRRQVWLPLIDGVDRIGCLEIHLEAPSDETLAELGHLLRLVAGALVTRGRYTDRFESVRRQRRMSLAAELQWQALPPPSFSTRDVSVAGMLEPAYDVGGDTFDYAHSRGTLSFAVLDAVGHGLGSSLISTLAIGAYRNARRSGLSLVETVDHIDEAIAAQFPDYRYATGVLARLDTASGALEWISCGHPSPLLLRDGRVITALESRPCAPLGLRRLVPEPPEVGSVQLEPGDSVLLYTDGTVEARRAHGVDFGRERLEELLHKAAAAGLAPAETVRRLTRAVLEYHDETLTDDATTVLVAWHPHR